MLPGEVVTLLIEVATELGFWGGIIGAMVYNLLRGLAVAAWAALNNADWFLDWQDRRYVRAFNEDTRQMQAFKVAASRRHAEQGHITPAAAFWLVVVVLATLAACAAPEPRLTGSEHWWDQQREAAKRRGW